MPVACSKAGNITSSSMARCRSIVPLKASKVLATSASSADSTATQSASQRSWSRLK